jgi:trehalose-6-phosphate synthase
MSPSTSGSNPRLIVVSNRLPLTITKKGDGSWTFSMSSGGLVSALSGLGSSMAFQWFGWPGLEVSTPEEQQLIERELSEKYSAVPVFISDEVADLHYNGFSNSILWPVSLTFNHPHCMVTGPFSCFTTIQAK